MRELFIRALSGFVYVAILLFAIFFNEKIYTVLFLVFGLLTLREYLRLISFNFWYPFVILTGLILLFSYYQVPALATHILLGITLLTGVYLIYNLFDKKTRNLSYLGKLTLTLFYISSGFVFLTLIPNYKQRYDPYIISGIFFLIWANDSFAFLIGKTIGKHKLFPRISPKKTIEGFFGGLLFSCITSILIYNFTETLTMPIWLCLAVIMSVFGTLGDLIQSKLKREAGVKDSGNIMPGHGGLFDRLDSILFAGPFVYLVLIIFDYVS